MDEQREAEQAVRDALIDVKIVSEVLRDNNYEGRELKGAALEDTMDCLKMALDNLDLAYASLHCVRNGVRIEVSESEDGFIAEGGGKTMEGMTAGSAKRTLHHILTGRKVGE